MEDASSSITRSARQLSGTGGETRELSERDAALIGAAMLDGGLADLELGAMLALLEGRRLTLPELLGFDRALDARCYRLRPPPGPVRPVVFASYHGVRAHPHLLPLAAMMLQRLGVPVLVHGALDGSGGVAAAYVFRELGVLPCSNVAQAQAQLDGSRLAFLPAAALAPGLAGLLALRGRLGFGTFAQSFAGLLAPFDGDALQVIAAGDAANRELLREFLAARGRRALLLQGTEGEPFADPRRRPRLDYLDAGECRMLFDEETAEVGYAATLPQAIDAHSTAAWIRRALAGEAPLPMPLVNQIACCLYGAGRTDDMNQAKAIVAVESGVLAAA